MDDQAKRDDDETEGDESRGRPPKDGGMGPLVNCKLPCQILAASRRNSGKSTLVASLLYQWLKMGRFKSHNIIIFSATAAPPPTFLVPWSWWWCECECPM